MGRCIAFVGGPGDLPADLRALDDEAGFEVRAVLGTHRAVDGPLPEETECIVVDHDPPTVDGLATAAWLRDRYPELPTVLYPTVESEALATAAVNAGFDAYVPRSAGGQVGVLRSQLQRLSSRTAPTRTRTLDPDGEADARAGSDEPPTEGVMFEALLTSLPRWVSIYVKDRLGRHLAVSGSDVAFDDAAVIHTPDGKVLHSREDITGKTDFDLYPADLATQAREQERRIMRTEEPDLNIMETVDDPTGDRYYYSTSKAPWYDQSGSVAGIVGITVDITERIEKTRAVERQNERLDRFANVLSHDLRNPLALAAGQVEVLQSVEDLPDATADPIEDLEWALDRIDALVTDTLDLARQGAVVDEPEPVNLANASEAAWRSVDCDRGTLEVAESLPRVEADPDRLQELLENLFRNADEHGCGEDEPITVTVGATSEGFFVGDDGEGIPEGDRDTVLAEGYTTSEDGTGFGLSIVREIAEAHDWSVEVTESADGGARFEFDGVRVLE